MPHCPHCNTPDGVRFSGSNKPAVAVYRCVSCGEFFRAAEQAVIAEASNAHIYEAEQRLDALIGADAELRGTLRAELSRAWIAGWAFDPEEYLQ